VVVLLPAEPVTATTFHEQANLRRDGNACGGGGPQVTVVPWMRHGGVGDNQIAGGEVADVVLAEAERHLPGVDEGLDGGKGRLQLFRRLKVGDQDLCALSAKPTGDARAAAEAAQAHDGDLLGLELCGRG
jgi:hypothetical protein